MSKPNRTESSAGNGEAPWVAPFCAVSALAVVTALSLVLFHSVLERLLSTKVDEELEMRVRAEISQRLERHLKGKGEPCAGTWEISVPILFRPGVGDDVADPVDEESIRRFMGTQTSRKVKTVYVFGFASADGPIHVNQRLACQRARTIEKKIRKGRWRVDVEVDGLGENHLTNGVASSRSARIAACVPTEGVNR